MEGKLPFVIESIQPNPAQSSVRVSISKAGLTPVTVELYDLLGTQIMSASESGTDFTLDLTPVAAGSYYLRLSSGGETETRKIEVMR
jgi:hypothetical protein